MAAPAKISSDRLQVGESLVDHLSSRPEAVAYFLCNVGDGDAQVILLPAYGTPPKRQVVIVDVAIQAKVPLLLEALGAAGILDLQAADDEPIALVVATHPHQDHIGGMPELLSVYGDRVAEFWDPGYFHSLQAYHDLMTEIERRPGLLYAQPTSGFRRWISDVAISVLSPSVQLRNRFDSYGVEINDSSISLRIEWPIHRYLERAEQGEQVTSPATRALVLGADAQTTSWAYVLVDFPFLMKSTTPAAKAIAAAQSNVDLLKADVLKVSHHGSKHGVNLELVERIGSKISLISSVAGGGKYNFPHTVAQDLIREGLHATAMSGQPQPPDEDLRIFYTCDEDDQGTTLGSVGLVMTTDECAMWRFGDGPGDSVDLNHGRRWAQDIW